MSRKDQNIKINNRSLDKEIEGATSSKPRHLIEFKYLNREKLSSIKYAFFEWSQSVTYHCFPKIFKEKTLFCYEIHMGYNIFVTSNSNCPCTHTNCPSLFSVWRRIDDSKRKRNTNSISYRDYLQCGSVYHKESSNVYRAVILEDI